MRFLDRTDGGRRLARLLADRELTSPLVLALPRGGVPVAFEIALALGAPLDVFVARKVGAPGRPEFGIGAIAESDGVVSNRQALQALGISTEAFERLVAAESRELDRRVKHYRGARLLPEMEARDVVLVDDGLATGVTAETALQAVRFRSPRRLVFAVPVCAPETAARLREIADEVICAQDPMSFHAVGQFYDRFDQTTDDEVLDLLAQASARMEVST